MIFTPLQGTAITFVSAYLGLFRAGMHRRNVRSWESIADRLRLGRSARGLSGQLLWKAGLITLPDEAWERRTDEKELWVMVKNAGAMLEMADYMDQNSNGVDRDFLATLRRDAVQIRVCTLRSMALRVFNMPVRGTV